MMLDGYKTHVSALLLMLAGVLFGFGYLTEDVFMAITVFLGGAGLSALRHGVKTGK